MDNFNFKNYKILHLIGEGSFGKVFKAEESDTKNVVALKILTKVSRLKNQKVLFCNLCRICFLARPIQQGNNASETRS